MFCLPAAVAGRTGEGSLSGLASRIVPPPVQSVHIGRPDLHEVVAAAATRRVTIVIGGPGWGKTATLASWAASTGAAWLSLDARDARLDRLLRGVTEAIQRRAPEVAVDLSAALAGELGPESDDEVRAAAFATAFCEAVATQLEDDLVLVLDDVHELPADAASTRFVEALCRQAPARLHLVLAARAAPKLRIQRLRGQGLVAEIGPPLLAFGVTETQALLHAAIGVDSHDLANSLRELTGGWPAALRLAIETLRGVPADRHEAVLGRLIRPGGELLEYLAEEVFSREPVAVREFLRRVAVLGRVTPALCEDVGLDGGEWLADLAGRGLLDAQDVDEQSWSLSRPVQAFLNCAFPLEDDEASKLLGAAADVHLQRGEYAKGLRRLVRAGDHDAVRRILAEHGGRLLYSGDTAAVLEATNCLPDDLRDGQVLRLHGHALQVRGDWIGALACYQRIAEDEDTLDPGLAWQMGLIQHLRGDIDDAIALYGKGRVDGDDTVDKGLLLSWQATAHWLRGEYGACRSLADRAAEVAQACRDPRAVAASETVLAMLARADGDQRANAHYSRALEAALEANDVLQIVRIRVNQGSHLEYEGRLADALTELDTAVQLAELCGYTAYHALALNNRAAVKTSLGQFDAAVSDYAACRDLYQRIGSRMVAYAHAGLGRVHYLRGEYAQAQAACEEALSGAERSGDVQALGRALPYLARLRAYDDPSAARAHCERALQVGGPLTRVQAQLARSWVALLTGDRRSAAAYATEAASEARRRRDRPGFAEALELSVLSSVDPASKTELLTEAAAVWQKIGDPLGTARVRLITAHLAGDDTASAAAEQEIRQLGVRMHSTSDVRELVDHDRRTGWDRIVIRTLGAFQVVRDGVPVPSAEFQSKKARDLLKILVTRRGRAITREQVIDLLWPDEDVSKVGGRLSVLLSSLRNVLRSTSQEDGPLVTDRHVIRLDCERVSVDVVDFFAAASAGLAAYQRGRPDAAVLLAAAEDRYAGDFLEDDPYEEWAEALREEARSTHLTVVRALADIAAQRSETWNVVRYTARLLQIDPYDEDAHLMLVRALIDSGRHGEARRHYRRYAERMIEFGIEPAAFPDHVTAGR